MRPLHSILCLFDGKVVPFEIDGIKSGKETRGHRFMAPEPFNVKGFADYREKLRKAKVILDGEERARLILDAAQALAKHEKLALVEDEGLLAENAGLTEWPVVLMGSFDEDFLVSAARGADHLDEGASEMLLVAQEGRRARQPIHISGESESGRRRQGHRRRQ